MCLFWAGYPDSRLSRTVGPLDPDENQSSRGWNVCSLENMTGPKYVADTHTTLPFVEHRLEQMPWPASYFQHIKKRA